MINITHALRGIILGALLGACALAADDITVIDKEIRYSAKTYPPDDLPRSAPEFKNTAIPLTPLPKAIASEGGWTENVYSGPLEQTTYREPGTNRVLHLVETTRGMDDTNTGALDYKIWYRISTDNGETYSELKPLVQKGEEYNYAHPIAGVWVGKNSFIFGGRIFRASNGEIMVPAYRWPLGEDGKPLNPHKAYTYMESGLLIGRWTADGADIEWDCGQFVRPEPGESTRGSDENAVIELSAPGRFMMVARGSNMNKPDFPGRKWLALSNDYGRTWTKPVPWTYADGSPIYSPAAHGALIRSKKNGRIYWIGNITPNNPDGNYPRFPLVIGEVDEKSCGLLRETLLTIDTRNPEYDTEKLQLSNFSTIEDPESGDLLISLTRMDDGLNPPTNDPATWYKGPRNWYRIKLPDKDSDINAGE